MHHTSEDMLNELYTALANVKDSSDMKFILEDLCTYKEVEQMAQRIKAADLLIQGKTYAEVITATSISSATLSRVSKCVQKGHGGYKKLLIKQ